METIIELLQKAIESENEDDKALFQKVLYLETFHFVYAVLKRRQSSWARDLVNDVYLRLFELKLEYFLTYSDNLIALVIKVAKRVESDHFKRCKRIDTLPIYQHDYLAGEYSKEKRGKIDLDLLKKNLTPKQVEIIHLRFNKDFEYCEISRLLNLNEDAVRKHSSRAIKALRGIHFPLSV